MSNIIPFPSAAKPEPRKFTIGQSLSTRSACDYDFVFTGKVISRTAKMIVLETKMNGKSRVGIKTDDDGNEWCYPFGRYSMAPVFRA